MPQRVWYEAPSLPPMLALGEAGAVVRALCEGAPVSEGTVIEGIR